ncbi:MAG: hypothetical protein A3J42_06750 [Candidatus Dadabacteria bacterium RIFCSPHIGHO2_12_FULL_53_21]|nr:MAG: hypothetical protein A3J42_06750 [Candidatus Dadabacteria bacterium RIFCSPHIGHO2_12_FULL_53_21]
MKKIIGLITLLAALPGLAGIYLLWKLGGLPPGAVFIVVNAIVFRGVCGTAGGGLLLTGRRWGSYLALVSWLYLIAVSLLTLLSLHNKGIQLSSVFLSGNFASFGKPLAWSLAKLALGIPIVYLLIKDLNRAGKSLTSPVGS